MTANRRGQLTSTGFVRELSEFLWQNGNVMTHVDWVECLAAELIAMCMGRERYIYDKLGKLYANGMAIIIGASSISYKTVAIKHARTLLKYMMMLLNDEVCRGQGFESYKDYVEAKKHHLTTKPFKKKGGQTAEAKAISLEWEKEGYALDQVEYYLYDYEAPTKFTSEGLSIFLQRHPQCAILGDEYTKLFRGATKKDYLIDNMEDLSRLYDNEADKYATASRGIDYPEDAYVTFTSATTYYLLKLMTEDFFLQGTGNRIKWVFDDLEDKIELDVHEDVTDFFWGIDDEEEYTEWMTKLANMLISIRELPKGLMPFNLDSSAILDRYRKEKYNKALGKLQKDLFDVDGNLMSRLAENAIKLAMVHCVGKAVLDAEDGIIRTMEIDAEDAQWAVDKMDRHFEHYIKMKKVYPLAVKGTIKTYRMDQEKVLYEIDRNDTLTIAKLSNRMGWHDEDTVKIVGQMMKNRQIIKYYIPRKYRKSQVYYLKRYDDTLRTESRENRLKWLQSHKPDLYEAYKRGEIS